MQTSNGGKGFTLVETLVAVAIFTLILGAVATSVVMLYRTQGFGFQQALAINEARRGIETMVKEIREAKYGDDGSYPIERADDKQFIFYSDIDKDSDAERVRYFLGTVSSGSLVQECTTSVQGGSCGVSFSGFLAGMLKSAEIRVSVDGDLDAADEFVTISADSTSFGNLCVSACAHCAGLWQGTALFNVTEQAADDSIQLIARASSRVHRQCPSASPNHSMKARFELTWTEEIEGLEGEFKKGVTEPSGDPVEYPQDQEKVSILTSYVRNAPPIFRYFDSAGNELIEIPVRLKDTKVMKVYLIINVNPARLPEDFELKSAVQLRNLKE